MVRGLVRMSGGSDVGLLMVQRMSQSEEVIRNEVKIEGSHVLYVSLPSLQGKMGQ